MKPSKLISDLFYLGLLAVAGYVVYKVWQSVTNAAGSVASAAGAVASTANSWTPSSLFKGLSDSVSSDLQAVNSMIASARGSLDANTPVLPDTPQPLSQTNPQLAQLNADLGIQANPSLFTSFQNQAAWDGAVASTWGSGAGL